jgi:hypothetical protein
MNATISLMPKLDITAEDATKIVQKLKEYIRNDPEFWKGLSLEIQVNIRFTSVEQSA